MAKQMQPTDERVTCDVCHRTMLRGETAEPYLTPSRERRLVCSLCAPRAQREGWIRESVAPETPTRPMRQSERRGLRRWRRDSRQQPAPESEGQALPSEAPEASSASEAPAGNEAPIERSAPRDPRHVRAVPTNEQLKLDRAAEVFNDSEHPRTIAGIARTLGVPQVNASTSAASSAEVLLTIAWELAWYQYAVDLSDQREPVQLRARGEELDELPHESRQWNAEARSDGSLLIGSPGSAGEGQANTRAEP